MSVKLKPVSEQTLVITGASSGIGLATAREACRQGGRVVLAARNGEALANFWGLVSGCQVALATLKARGGALVNVGSVVSDTAFPVQGMYIASKHAVLGYTDSLRQELLHDQAPVSLTLIRPAAIDTPFPQNARNYFAQKPKLPDPVYKPEEVAAAILHAAAHPVRDIYVGGGGRLMSGLARHLPEMMDWVGGRVGFGQQFTDEPAGDQAGALHTAGRRMAGRVRGEHPGVVQPFSLYNRVARHPLLTLGAVVAAGAAVAGALATTTGDDWEE